MKILQSKSLEQAADIAIKEISPKYKQICLTGGRFGKRLSEKILENRVDISSWKIFLTDERLNCLKQDQNRSMLLPNLERVSGFNVTNLNFFLQGHYADSYQSIVDKIKNNHFDVLLISDVIEHIGDPLTFLKDINRVFKNVVDRIIITTPNAFRLENFLSAYKNEEVINTDHKFWFSQYTLSKLIIESGFEIKGVGMCQHLIGGYTKAFKNFIVNLFPNLKQTLVFEFVFKK